MMQRSPRGFAAFTVVLGLLALSGCGPGAERLYRVSGTVTYGGQPIPKGNIFFDPTANEPQGYAHIVNGKYDTGQEGQGVRGGTYNIRVNGFDGKEANEAPFGQALFPEYNGTKELPREDSTYDLDIPKPR